MVRVPNTMSLTALIGPGLDLDQGDEAPFEHISPAEVDQLIMRCRRALPGWRRDCLHRDPAIAEDALAAVETIQGTLMELLKSAPPEKRAKIEALLVKSASD